MMIITTAGDESDVRDGRELRRAALAQKVPIITTIAAARATGACVRCGGRGVLQRGWAASPGRMLRATAGRQQHRLGGSPAPIPLPGPPPPPPPPPLLFPPAVEALRDMSEGELEMIALQDYFPALKK